jgi:hypothetical protein
MTEVARAADVTWDTLYKALSTGGESAAEHFFGRDESAATWGRPDNRLPYDDGPRRQTAPDA